MQKTFTTVQCKLFIHHSGLCQYEYVTLITRKASFNWVTNLEFITSPDKKNSKIHSFNWHLVSALSVSACCSNNARTAFICTCTGHHWPELICILIVFYCFIIQCKKKKKATTKKGKRKVKCNNPARGKHELF